MECVKLDCSGMNLLQSSARLNDNVLQIVNNSLVGDVCSDGFDQLDAIAACREIAISLSVEIFPMISVLSFNVGKTCTATSFFSS